MLDFLSALFQSLAPLWEMSVTAAYAAAIVIVLRLLLKRRAPKQVLCLLWLVVFARLLIPVSLESPLSIVPGAQQVQFAQELPSKLAGGGQTHSTQNQNHNPIQNQTPEQTGGQAGGVTVNPVSHGNSGSVPTLTLPEGAAPSAPQPEAPAPSLWQAVLAGVWLAGAAALALYALFSYFRLRRCLFDAIRARDGAWEHPAVNSPFILGVLRPRIYLPAGLSGQPRQFILCHERAHLRRLDHIVKPVCWIALALHWFNPMVWAAYILMSRDIEAACDEAVIRRLGPKVKADYSATLLALATNGRVPAPCPLAFDEGNAKGRIKNVLRYRRPALWIVVVSVIAAVLAAVCLLTDPVAAKEPDADPSADPSASASQPPANLADTLLDPWMKEVLDGERDFRIYDSDRNIGELADVLFNGYPPENLGLTFKLALLDLNRDGGNELVIFPQGSYDDTLIYQIGYLILQRVGDTVQGYNPSWRSIGDLKADGTFDWSSSAFNWGTGSARFDDGMLEVAQITWCDNPNEDDDNYFVDGLKATREEFFAAYDFQAAKLEPNWYTYADGVLSPWHPDNAEVVSQTDAGEAKLWLDDAEIPWLEWNGATAQMIRRFTKVQSPTVYCRDFDGDGENEVLVTYMLNGFLQFDLYEWNSGQVACADAFDSQSLLLRFNQNNVAGYNKDTRGLTVTYAHTEGDPDSEDYYRHYVTGSCTLPEDFFNGYEHIRDGYPHVYANQFHLFYLQSDTNTLYFDFDIYMADETMQELTSVDILLDTPPYSWYAEHYMIDRPVGITYFLVRYDGAKWVVQEPDQLNLDYQDEAGQTTAIPLSDYALAVPVPDFLDEEQQLLYRQAFELYRRLFSAMNDEADFWPEDDNDLLEPAENVERNGFTYIAARGLYGWWSDFEQATLSVFTRDFWNSKNTIQSGDRSAELYINVNGRMYYVMYGRGATGCNFETFRLVERTDDALSFIMTGYYIDPYQWEGETTEEWEARQNGDWEYSIDFPMRMVKTADGWRFDEFHSAHTDCDIYPFSTQKVQNPSKSAQ